MSKVLVPLKGAGTSALAEGANAGVAGVIAGAAISIAAGYIPALQDAQVQGAVWVILTALIGGISKLMRKAGENRALATVPTISEGDCGRRIVNSVVSDIKKPDLFVEGLNAMDRWAQNKPQTEAIKKAAELAASIGGVATPAEAKQE
jgi:hypothetical protein